MVLLLHHRYRSTGGEERTVAAIAALVRERLGEEVDVLERDSATVATRRAAAGLLRGGIRPDEVARAVRRTGARVVHAHNLHPTFGWRALAAARDAGARTVLHLHNFRAVCAVGTCFTRGADCTRCHGRDTRPGVRLRCRGSLAEALPYAAGLALQQRRFLAHADAVVVPSRAALDRLLALGLPLDASSVHVVAPPVDVPATPPPRDPGDAALVVGRLGPEKGVEVAVDACRIAGLPLRVAGDGPQRDALRVRAAGADVTFLGRVDAAVLALERARARVCVVPSRSAETFGLAAAEALAAGVPVVASRIGALPELLDDAALVRPGDPDALATALLGEPPDPSAARRRLAEVASPDRVATRLAEIYAGA